MKNLIKIKGDASFRKFFRKKKNDYSSVVVLAKKEKFKNLLNSPLQYFLLLILLFFSVKFINIPDFAVTDNASFDFGSLISKGFNFLLLTTHLQYHQGYLLILIIFHLYNVEHS